MSELMFHIGSVEDTVLALSEVVDRELESWGGHPVAAVVYPVRGDRKRKISVIESVYDRCSADTQVAIVARLMDRLSSRQLMVLNGERDTCGD